MFKSFVLLLIVLVVASTSFYYIVQATGSFSIPLLLEKAGVASKSIPSFLYSLPTYGIPSSNRPTITPQAKHLISEPGDTPRPTSLEPIQSVPPEYQSGNSRFSQGSCIQDSDCMQTGCSNEVCAPESVISSCEIRYDFPQAQHYTCGCVKRHCGWR